MSRRVLRLLLLPVLGSVVSVGAFVVPAQAAGSGTATVEAASDAWYAASSACTASPTGCLPAAAPVSPYPAKTLNVGAALGQEESRTYITLGLTALPAGTSVTGGTLRLPVSPTQDGSVAPDTATMQACAVTGAVKDDVEGATEAPPQIDCKRATAPAKYVAAAGSAPEMFTVDLSAFATAWASGASSQSIVLLPSSDTAPPSSWHVTLSAHDRDVAAPMHITALVSYATAAGDLTGDFQDAVSTPADAGSGSASFAAPPLAPVATTQLPSAPQAVPQVAPQAAPVTPAQFQPQAAVTVGGFAYPAVFLLPILLALACGYLARALTRDLQPAAA